MKHENLVSNKFIRIKLPPYKDEVTFRTLAPRQSTE